MVIRGYRRKIENCYNLLIINFYLYLNGETLTEYYLDVKKRILQNIDYYYSKLSRLKFILYRLHFIRLTKKLYKVGALTDEEFEEKKRILSK